MNLKRTLFISGILDTAWTIAQFLVLNQLKPCVLHSATKGTVTLSNNYNNNYCYYYTPCTLICLFSCLITQYLFYYFCCLNKEVGSFQVDSQQTVQQQCPMPATWPAISLAFSSAFLPYGLRKNHRREECHLVTTEQVRDIHLVLQNQINSAKQHF